MNRFPSFVVATLVLMTLTGCAIQYRAPVVPPRGFLITTIKAPLTTDFSNTPVGEKQGESSTYYFLEPILTRFDFSWGDAAIREAATNGNLKTVEYADYELLTIFSIFSKFTVTVYGN